MQRQNTIQEKSRAFAVRIIHFHKYLLQQREYILSKQLLKSSTSIGANVQEAQFAQSKKDFIAKLYIAYKEAKETDYWLSLIAQGGYDPTHKAQVLQKDVREIIALLTAIIKKAKMNLAISKQ